MTVLIILMNIVFAFIGAMLLGGSNRAGTGFILGLLFGPIGLIIAMVMRSNTNKEIEAEMHQEQLDAISHLNAQKTPDQKRTERECPYCAELILKKAKLCKHCGKEIET